MTNIAERQKIAAKRAALLREFSDRQFTREDLLEIFGRALLAKAAAPTERHNVLGKHHAAHDDQCRFHHPAGTKLVRRFIRQARGEQVEYRRIYARMTGHQYGAAS